MCIFCNLDNREVVWESALAAVIKDEFPVTKDHLLVIPKAHYTTYFDIDSWECLNAIHVAERNALIYLRDLGYTDFNIGSNIGKFAGQTVGHYHIHVIPRTLNDVKNPIGGVRNIFPNGDYTKGLKC
jgi:ATP adenylyltransferase